MAHFEYPKKPESKLRHEEFVTTGKQIIELRNALAKITGGSNLHDGDVVFIEDDPKVLREKSKTHTRIELELHLREAVARHEELRTILGKEANPE